MIDEVHEELYGLAVNAPVFLYKFDLNPIGVAETYYYAPHLLNGSPVSFDGQVYQYGAVHIGEIAQDGSGESTYPALTLPNKDRFISTLCVLHKDCVGAKITRIKTLKTFLDTQPMANGNAFISRNIFVVNRKTALDDLYGQFELRPMSSIEGRKIPGQVCLKNICKRTYRRWDSVNSVWIMGTCPYNGANKFTRTGASTADPTLDVCSKDLANGCDKRYPNVAGGDPKPTWAMPGMQQV